jgi:hypothetical protein
VKPFQDGLPEKANLGWQRKISWYRENVRHGVIVGVETSRAVRQAEVRAARTMPDRTEECFGPKL